MLCTCTIIRCPFSAVDEERQRSRGVLRREQCGLEPYAIPHGDHDILKVDEDASVVALSDQQDRARQPAEQNCQFDEASVRLKNTLQCFAGATGRTREQGDPWGKPWDKPSALKSGTRASWPRGHPGPGGPPHQHGSYPDSVLVASTLVCSTDSAAAPSASATSDAMASGQGLPHRSSTDASSRGRIGLPR